MKRKAVKTFLLIVIISMSVRAIADVPMIHPGRGVADIRLGVHMSNIINYYLEKEKPDYTIKIKRDPDFEYLLFYTSREIIFVCDSKLVVNRIIYRSPSLFLERSFIRVGSTLEHVQRAYSAQANTFTAKIFREETRDTTSNYILYLYLRRGLIFTVMDKKVVAITVLKPDEFEPNENFTEFKGIMGVGSTWKELLYPKPPKQK